MEFEQTFGRRHVTELCVCKCRASGTEVRDRTSELSNCSTAGRNVFFLQQTDTTGVYLLIYFLFFNISHVAAGHPPGTNQITSRILHCIAIEQSKVLLALVVTDFAFD